MLVGTCGLCPKANIYGGKGTNGAVFENIGAYNLCSVCNYYRNGRKDFGNRNITYNDVFCTYINDRKAKKKAGVNSLF